MPKHVVNVSYIMCPTYFELKKVEKWTYDVEFAVLLSGDSITLQDLTIVPQVS